MRDVGNAYDYMYHHVIICERDITGSETCREATPEEIDRMIENILRGLGYTS